MRNAVDIMQPWLNFVHIFNSHKHVYKRLFSLFIAVINIENIILEMSPEVFSSTKSKFLFPFSIKTVSYFHGIGIVAGVSETSIYSHYHVHF